MKEKRYINEIRSVEGENSRHIVGYALLFNVRSVQLGDFTEVIMPEALNDEILRRSDVLALLNHDISRGVLARSRNGEGSLTLTIDEKGLKYEFDAPNTALGDELVEGIKRGDIRNSSFSFLVKRDEWQQTEEGGYLRIIHEFGQLFDISPVYQPAYDETSVDCRGLDRFKEEIERRMNEDNKDKEVEEKEEQKPAEEPQQTEEKPADEEAPKSEDEEKKSCQSGDESEKREDEPEDNKDEESEPADAPADEKGEEVKEDEPKDKDEKRNKTIAMKKINLTEAIRAAYSGKISDEQATVFNEARNKMIANGLTIGDNEIVMPFVQGEKRAAPATANGVFTASYTDAQGAVNVQTDVYNILEPLRNNLVLAQAGATVLSGLRGNVRIPKMSKGNAFWESETAAAQKSGQTFDKIDLKPLRCSAYVEISKQLLMQSEDSNINDIITRDVLAAVSEKIESTFLGADAGDDTKPAGIFNGITANTAAIKYDDVVDYETALEEKNVNNYIYILSPKAKAALRKLALDSGSGRFVMEDGEVLGRQSYVTGNVVDKGLLVIDPAECVFGIWGNGMSILVDPYTTSLNDTVRIVVTVYVDIKMRRSEAAKAVILK